jgi:phage terminase large subunit-like protein
MLMRTAAVGEKPKGIVITTMTPLQGLTVLLQNYTDGS